MASNDFPTLEGSVRTSKLLKDAAASADRHYDGHLTIMKFTTGWKVCGHTDLGLEDVFSQEVYETLDEALDAFIHRPYKDELILNEIEEDDDGSQYE